MKCERCPRAGECLGSEIPRLCELVDPDHPDHASEYVASLDPQPPEPTPIADPPEPGCCPPPIL